MWILPEIFNRFIPCVLYFILSLFAVLAFMASCKYIKNMIICEITAERHKGIIPKRIANFEIELQSTSMELCEEMEEIDHIAEIKNSLCDYIIGTPFLIEFVSIPNKMFNGTKPKLELGVHPLSLSARIEITQYCINISKLLSKCKRERTIKKESTYLKNYTESLFFKHSSYFDKDLYAVRDIFGYTEDIFIHMATESHLGKLAKKDKLILGHMKFMMSLAPNLTDTDYNPLKRLRALFSYFKYIKSLDYVSKYILGVIQKREEENNINRNSYDDTIQLVLENKNLFNLEKEKYLGCTFEFLVAISCSQNGPRIANFLMEVSFDSRVYINLALEQRAIVEEHGFKINQNQLNKMRYLDATLKESIRLTLASGNERKVENDYVLSNGSIISKDAIIKFNLFSHFRNEELYGYDPHSFVPERHLANGTGLSDVSPDNYIWSTGEHMCPAIEYCVAQLKTSAAIFIRSFEINQGGSINAKHKGYRMGNVSRHVNTRLYLKPHDILEYQPIFY